MDEHAEAILARLRAHPYLTVVDGPADGTQDPPYVVVYVHVNEERRTKLEGGSDETWITVTTHSVAANGTGARIVAGNVREQLLDHRPVVAGWKSDRITHPVGRTPDWAEVAGLKVMDAVDQWDYRTEPA